MAVLKNQPLGSRLLYAWQGLCFALRSERSLRFQSIVFGLVLIALLIVRPEALWWALALITSAGVLAAELFNTALETLIDHLHPDLHPQVKIVKDCAAAAVLVWTLASLAVGAAFLVHLYL